MTSISHIDSYLYMQKSACIWHRAPEWSYVEELKAVNKWTKCPAFSSTVVCQEEEWDVMEYTREWAYTYSSHLIHVHDCMLTHPFDDQELKDPELLQLHCSGICSSLQSQHILIRKSPTQNFICHYLQKLMHRLTVSFTHQARITQYLLKEIVSFLYIAVHGDLWCSLT